MSEIPEDIPVDLWRYAESVERVWRDLPPREAIEHHARAILAERQRCVRLLKNPNRSVLGIDEDALSFFTDSMARIILEGEYDALAVKRELPRSN